MAHHAQHLLLKRADGVPVRLIDGFVVPAQARVLAVEEQLAIQVRNLDALADTCAPAKASTL